MSTFDFAWVKLQQPLCGIYTKNIFFPDITKGDVLKGVTCYYYHFPTRDPFVGEESADRPLAVLRFHVGRTMFQVSVVNITVLS